VDARLVGSTDEPNPWQCLFVHIVCSLYSGRTAALCKMSGERMDG